MIVHPELKIKSHLLLADDIKALCYISAQNEWSGQGNIKQDQTASLKVALLLDDFLTIFKMDQTFFKSAPNWKSYLESSHITGFLSLFKS